MTNDPYEHFPQNRPMPHPGSTEQPDGFGNWCPECGERRDLCQCNNSICEHFEIPETVCCEYCNAYPKCPLHDRMLILVKQVQKNWKELEPDRDDFSDDDENFEDYDYTEGDIGQDGII